MGHKYEFSQDGERHQCISWLENKSIIFKCQQCDFIRKMHVETGQLTTIKKGNQMALHAGLYKAVATKEVLISEN